MNSRERTKRVRRRKVAQLAAYSRRHSVNNCTIPKITNGGTGEWNIPKEGYSQTKSLRKKYKKKYYNKDGTLRKIISHESDWNQFKKAPIEKKSYDDLLIEHKVAKWERKHPRPIKPNDKEPDLFEQEFMAPWKMELMKAIDHIREVVLSKRDKLPLTGRFQQSDNEFVEEKVAEIKDKEGEGNKINQLDPKKSPLLKKAQKKTNQIKTKRSNLVCTNLRDKRNQRGRIILPKAA